MSRGIVLIAHNNGKDDYYAMAVSVAKRAAKFLNLPSTLVTDHGSLGADSGCFDKIIQVEPDMGNWRVHQPWINKGRHRVFDLTPYTDTLVLDTDYLINSGKLLSAFEIPSDFCLHRNVTWLCGKAYTERIAPGLPTHWATVLRFRKTSRTESIFRLVETIQENYSHYADIYGFQPHPFRNDYAFTIALKVVNGHLPVTTDYFNWNLVHIPLDVNVYRDGSTQYTLIAKDKITGRNSYIKVSDLDFHMLSKKNFLELIDE